MPWHRPGVVAPDFPPGVIMHGPNARRWARIGIATAIAAAAGVPIILAVLGASRIAWIGSGALTTIALTILAILWMARMISRIRDRGALYPPWWTLGVFLAIVLGGTTLTSVLFVMGGIRPFPYLAMVLAGVGMSVAVPVRPRIGEGLFCTACDYPYSFTDPDGPPPPEACSECGAMWHSPSGLSRGTKVRAQPWRVLVMMAVLMGLIFITISSGPWVSVSPTAALIARVTAPRAGFVVEEWAELSGRRLSESERLRLARGLIDLRLAEQSLSREGASWLEAEAAAGGLPPDLLERYYVEMFEARIAGPSECRVGEPVAFGLDTIRRGFPGVGDQVLIAVGGYAAADRPDVVSGRLDATAHAALVGVRSVWLGRVRERPTAPIGQIVFDEPGAHEVVCVYWMIVVPQHTQASAITWGPAGEPSLPPDALFTQRREIRHQIRVLP